MKNEILDFFAKFIEQETGIVYTDVTYFQLEGRLQNIIALLGLTSLDQLFATAKSEGIKGSFRDLLLDLATNNETSFFRDTGVFQAIVETFLPTWLAEGGRDLRVWSAASSTGQEAYSLAMSFEDFMKQGSRSFNYEITASDISDRVLKRAAAGRYTQLEVQRGLAATRLVKNFRQVADSGDGCIWEISADLRAKVRFLRLNLIDPWPSTLGMFDLILCRNVLIYQNVEQKKKVVAKLYEHLRPNACLVLGGAESLVGLSNDFKQMPVSGAIFYQPSGTAPSSQAV